MAPSNLTSIAAQENAAKTIPRPVIAQLHQKGFTVTIPATNVEASTRVVATALCTTAMKLGPGVTTAARYT
jgi:hypothetical protein